jgi:ribulose-bisphosphate carboxylase large chain
MDAESIEVVYRVRVGAPELDARVEALLLEQTVELPRSALHTAFVRDHLVGRVLSKEAVGPGDYRVTLAQPAIAAADDPAQLLNVLFGNCSLQPEVELEDVRLPPSLVAALGGPRFGIEGIRRLTGVQGRALTASVLKPIGLTVAETASLCHTLALSGLDIIKDDHGHADHAFGPFAARVRTCLAATAEAARETGRRAVYVPNLIGPPGVVMHQAWQAKQLGAQAVMVSPMLVGLPFLNELVGQIGMPVLAHPAFGGSTRIAPAALLGKLFPLFGADAVIFPNSGGRFSFSRDTCAGIARALRAPDAAIAPAFPVPAGGMKVEGMAAVQEFYGPDTVLLVGGSLLDTPDKDALLSRSRQFVAAVHSFPYPK